MLSAKLYKAELHPLRSICRASLLYVLESLFLAILCVVKVHQLSNMIRIHIDTFPNWHCECQLKCRTVIGSACDIYLQRAHFWICFTLIYSLSVIEEFITYCICVLKVNHMTWKVTPVNNSWGHRRILQATNGFRSGTPLPFRISLLRYKGAKSLIDCNEIVLTFIAPQFWWLVLKPYQT